MPLAYLSFQAEVAGGTSRSLDVRVSNLVMAGWAGRDPASIQAHIDELAELGVSPPSEVPCFYRVAANQITTRPRIQVLGTDTSGEVEFFLVSMADGLWVGAGSDETDRKLEAHSVAASKQICIKSAAPVLWRFEEVVGHWDQLRLRSWITTGDQRRLYQNRPVSDLRRPEDLISRLVGADATLPHGTVLFGGTCQVIGSVGGGSRFDYELEDPVLNRSIRHGYDIETLPVVS